MSNILKYLSLRKNPGWQTGRSFRQKKTHYYRTFLQASYAFCKKKHTRLRLTTRFR